jgi:hypothetical protein
MTSILEKLEADFAALEAKMGEGGKEIMSFEEVLPVVEKMQHSLGECSTLVLLYSVVVRGGGDGR